MDEAFVEGDIAQADGKGETPLIKATVYGSTAVVRALIRRGADLARKTTYGMTAWGWSRRRNWKDVRVLLDEAAAIATTSKDTVNYCCPSHDSSLS